MFATCRFLVVAVLLCGCIAEPEVEREPDFALAASDKLIADCGPFEQSTLARLRATQTVVNAGQDWQRILEQAGENTDILLLDGVYQLTQPSVYLQPNVTVRAASGNRDAVQIIGKGYRVRGQGFVLSGEGITIANLTISNIRDHAISVVQGGDNAYLYNLHVYDIGTQHIKGNAGGIHNGIVACSSIGYTANGAVGDYNGGVDLHDAHHWHVARNFFYNISGDGSGCEVDVLCGNYTSGPAILIWNGSTDAAIYDNTIVDSFRNIALGLGRGHDGGWVANNRIVQTIAGDAGIELQTASNVLIEENTVVLGSNYPGAIEFRQSSNILIRNNRVSAQPWDRGSNRSIFLYRNSVVGSEDIQAGEDQAGQ